MQRRFPRTATTTVFSVTLLLVSFGDLRYGENVAIGDSECKDEGAGCGRADYKCPGPERLLAERSDYVVLASPLSLSANTTEERYLSTDPVDVAVGSVVRFELLADPDPARELRENDLISFEGTPTATSSDDSVLRVTDIDGQILTAEVRSAGEATLQLNWDGATGSRPVQAIEPTRYDVALDDEQFLGATSLWCSERNNGRSAEDAYRVLMGDRFRFSLSPRKGTSELFGQPTASLIVEEVSDPLDETSEFIESLPVGTDGYYEYEFAEDAVDRLLRISNARGSAGAARYFLVVPAPDQLDFIVTYLSNERDDCEVEDDGTLVCPYERTEEQQTILAPVIVAPTYQDQCIEKANRCDVRLQLTVSPGSDNEADHVTIENPCLGDERVSCSPQSPCDVAVDGLFAVEFECGDTVSMSATYGGLTRGLRFEPVSPE